MSYSGNSSIIGNGQASAAQIDAWMRSHNPGAPNLGASIISNSVLIGANSDLICGQIALETGYWTSAIAKQKNNPAGLGAINSSPQASAITFPTIDAGIRAQVAHIGSYVLGNANPLKAADPRFAAMPASSLGVVKVLSDLGGRWAVPGQGYGQHISQLANQLVTFAASHGGTMAADDPEAIWQPSPNFYAGGNACNLIILHTTEGAFAGSLSWLCNSQSQASAQYIVSADGSKIVQMVRETDTAWGCGNLAWNKRAIQIEQEGYEAKGGFSEALYQAVGELIGRIAKRHNIPLDRAHIIGHDEVPSPDGNGFGGIDHHSDPGPHYDFDKVIAIAKGGGTPSPATPNNDDSRHYFEQTHFWVGGGFWQFWQHRGGLKVFGYPLSREFVGWDGLTTQWFERACFTWKKGADPKNWDVVLKRLGAEDLKADKAAHAGAFAPQPPPK